MRRKLKKKTRNLIIVETLMFAGLFFAIFYCQYFDAKKPLKEALLFATGFCAPLLAFTIPVGIATLLRGKFFVGDYESPLKDDDSKGGPKDRNYGVINQLH